MEPTWYWQNYEICRKWQKTHKSALMEVANANSQLNRGHILPNAISTERADANNEYYDISSDRVTSEIDDCVHGRLDGRKLMVCDDEENEYSSDESQLTFEVDKEFLDFIEISMKHKQELKKKRKKESSFDQYHTQNQEKKNQKTSRRENLRFEDDRKFTPAPDCPIGKKRLEEMKLLYGSSAQKIQGMETSLQLSFNKKCDSLNPMFWPIVPLNTT